MVSVQPILLRAGVKQKFTTGNVVASASKNLKNIIKGADKSLVLPVVGTLIMYVNKDKIAEEIGKSYHPYTDAVKRAKEEFADRKLPWDDDYADTLTGRLSIRGSSVIKHYDETKQYFLDNHLPFSNSYVDLHTGLKNAAGKTIERNCEAAKELLRQNNIPVKDGYFNKNGQITSYHKKQFGFQGYGDSPHETIPAEIGDGELIGEMPPVYDETSDMKEVLEIDKAISALEKLLANPTSEEIAAETADILGHLADNPAILIATISIAAEIIPFVRFIKPLKDFLKGDFEKALVGTASRGVDVVLSPVKLFFAGCFSFVIGTTGLLMNQDDLTYTSGFKSFYEGWAEMRDDLENQFIGRPTKDELIKKRKAKAEKLKQKLIEAKDKKLSDIQKKKQEYNDAVAAYEKKVENYQATLGRQIAAGYNTPTQGQSSAKQEFTEYKTESAVQYTLPEGWKRSEKDKTQKCLTEFYELLQEYRRLKPDADVSNYNNWENWTNEQLRKNSKILKSRIQKCYHRESLPYRESTLLSGIYDEETTQSRYDEMRVKFSDKLDQYKRLKPSADVSMYQNWREWCFKKLVKNYGILKLKVNKLLARN